MALETPSRPSPPLHGKCHLKFPFWFFETFPYIKCDKYVLCIFVLQKCLIYMIKYLCGKKYIALQSNRQRLVATRCRGRRDSAKNANNWNSLQNQSLQIWGNTLHCNTSRKKRKKEKTPTIQLGCKIIVYYDDDF